MKKFSEYTDRAADFAEPYAKKTTQFFVDAKDAIEDKYYREKKKRIRKRRLVKLKEFLDSAFTAALIVLAVTAGVVTAVKVLHKLTSCSFGKRTKHVGGHNCGCGTEKQKSTKHDNKPDKHSDKKKNDNSSGYITL